MCSSILALQAQNHLKVKEKIYVSCRRSDCVAQCRQRRNLDSTNGAGIGFRLAFRCANELMVDEREPLECERE